jgi:hypothetical protein
VYIEDARDAYEQCHGLERGEMKEACYMIFGVDAKRTETYLHAVENLERLVIDDGKVRAENDIKMLRIGPLMMTVDLAWFDKFGH